MEKTEKDEGIKVITTIMDTVADVLLKVEAPGYFSKRELEIYKEDPMIAINRGILEGFKACLGYLTAKQKEDILCQHHKQFVTEPKK